MVTFAQQIALDKSVFFNPDEFGKSVTLNSVPLVGVITAKGNTEDIGYSYDYLDIKFSALDIFQISYKTDKLVVDGETWGFPKLLDHTSIAYTIRFRRNEKPLLTAGRPIRGS